MDKPMTLTEALARAVVEMEKIARAKEALADLEKDVYKNAEAHRVDKKGLKRVLQRRKREREDVEAEDQLVFGYEDKLFSSSGASALAQFSAEKMSEDVERVVDGVSEGTRAAFGRLRGKGVEISVVDDDGQHTEVEEEATNAPPPKRSLRGRKETVKEAE